MDREQAIVVLKILKTAYPRFYADLTKDEAENTVGLWIDMFKHEDPNLVVLAVKELINSFKFPPTIADVKEKMYSITNMNTETPIEVWNTIRKAIRNSGYHSYEEFEKLPENAKKFVGSPNQLREWAISTDFNESVVRGQFLKQYEVIEKREKENKMMLPEVKVLMTQFLEGSDVQKLLN